ASSLQPPNLPGEQPGVNRQRKEDWFLALFALFSLRKSREMKFEKIHNKGQAQLFQNSYMEMLTKTHPLVIWGMYVPVIVYFIYLSHFQLDFSYTKIFFTFAAGTFFW